jgi:hypothetical protein
LREVPWVPANCPVKREKRPQRWGWWTVITAKTDSV